MKKYVYANQDELRSIIDKIKAGTDEQFIVHNAQGRRLKYDFATNRCVLAITDDGVPQTNPYFNPLVHKVDDVVVEDEIPNTEADASETDNTEVTLDEDPNAALHEGDSIELDNGDKVVVTSVNPDNPDEAEVEEADDTDTMDADYDAIIDRLKSDLSIAYDTIDQLNKDINDQTAVMHELREAHSGLQNDIDNPTTDYLIDKLVAKGYKVSISKLEIIKEN